MAVDLILCTLKDSHHLTKASMLPYVLSLNKSFASKKLEIKGQKDDASLLKTSNSRTQSFQGRNQIESSITLQPKAGGPDNKMIPNKNYISRRMQAKVQIHHQVEKRAEKLNIILLVKLGNRVLIIIIILNSKCDPPLFR